MISRFGLPTVGDWLIVSYTSGERRYWTGSQWAEYDFTDYGRDDSLAIYESREHAMEDAKRMDVKTYVIQW